MAASGDDKVIKLSKTIKGFKYLQIHRMRDEGGGSFFSKSVDKMSSYQRAKSFVLNFDREQTFELTYLDGRTRTQ